MSDQTDSQRKRIWLTVAVIVGFIIILMALFIVRISQPPMLSNAQLRAHGTFVFDKPRLVKDFQLTDHLGNAFAKEQLKGKWSLLFFGFTHCPDVCPTTMVELKKVYTQLQETEMAGDLQVVMVSVDPARDTPKKLAEYVPFFHPEFIGVTGEFLALYYFATNVNVAFNKVPQSTGVEGGYDVDHSSNIVLINPMGDYHGFIKQPFDLVKMKMTLRSIRLQF